MSLRSMETGWKNTHRVSNRFDLEGAIKSISVVGLLITDMWM